ncbi:MAG: hypothetical protein M3083_21025 [Actinomycetota bacterium]|nr:hypothetical protein [Actinomycetota bacterium]
MGLGVVAVAEFLLVVTALAKLTAPAPAAGALRSLGLRVPHHLVRIGAAAELVAGAGALASGWPVFAGLVALWFAAFAAFIVVARRRPEAVTSCGCLSLPMGGSDRDTPPTVGHLVFDIAAAAVCLGAAVWPVPGVVTALGRQPMAGIPMIGLVVLGCWLSMILLTVAPQTALAATTARTARAAKNRA